MTPLLLLGAFLVAAGAARAGRSKGQPRLQQLGDKPFRPQIVLVNNCQAWAIPDAWWIQIANPKFAELVLAGQRDAALLSYALLKDELANCPLPPSMDVDVDVSTAENYWPGPPQMLYLVQHVAQAVEGGLQRFEADGGVPTLALPLPQLGGDQV